MPKDNTEEKTSLGGAPKDGAFASDNNGANGADAGVKPISEQLGNIVKKVSDKIKACENILIALSKDPNVDEISAAIGLSMILNKLGKHVTAIYSGETPNTLEFLKPEETFEKDTNSLQDFIIALNKDKADHLRYKIEGDYVKVYITPYKTTITDKDLEFSQGDFNVDLVVSIDVESGEALDDALSEYGRIMHDATAINITTNAAGHFAELEWSDPSMSSCSEMVAMLAEELGYANFEQPVATALLTGIVSNTDRFSNARTTSETMALSSKLMQAGADQQLISSNIMKPAEEKAPEEAVKEEAPTEVPEEEIVNDNEEVLATDEPLIPEPTLAVPTAPVVPEAPVVAPEMPVQPVVPEAPVQAEVPTVPTPVQEPAPAPAVGNDTFALPGQASADAVQAEMNKILSPTSVADTVATQEVPVAPVANPVMPETPAAPQIISQGGVIEQNVMEPVKEEPDYGSMIDQALTEALAQNPTANPAMTVAPAVPTQAPEANTIPNLQYIDPNATPAMMMNPTPAQPVAPAVPTTPEVPVNPVAVNPQVQATEINLPPAPTPNVDTMTFDIPK